MTLAYSSNLQFKFEFNKNSLKTTRDLPANTGMKYKNGFQFSAAFLVEVAKPDRPGPIFLES
jgi:hypothetical protein